MPDATVPWRPYGQHQTGANRSGATSGGTMNTPSRSVQRLGALGIIYAALYVAANAFTLNVPGEGAGAPQVITYYSAHFAPITASIFLTIAGSVVFLFFLGPLRRALDLSSESRVLSSVVTAGGAVYAAGLLVDALLAN